MNGGKHFLFFHPLRELNLFFFSFFAVVFVLVVVVHDARNFL